MARVVAENIFSFNPKFWLRIATRADSAPSPADRERLGEMANRVMVLVDAMVKTTEEKLSGSARVLQDILAAAADENGEWYLPLAPEQVGAASGHSSGGVCKGWGAAAVGERP